MKTMLKKRIAKTTAWAIAVIFLFLNSGCGFLNMNSFNVENGAYIKHYNSCGPNAMQDALRTLEEKYISKKNISTEIQKGGNNTRLLMALIHHDALLITFPCELKKYFTKRGYKVTTTSLDALKPSDTAIVLIKGVIKKLQWHWISYPTYSKKEIESFYGSEVTSVISVYLIKKKAAN
jgi:hypothetical protein